MERTFIVRVEATDELGKQIHSVLPMKAEGEPIVTEIIAQLDAQYPHLKHRVTEIEELKTPAEVENWQHSYLGTVFGSEHQPDREDA
ncbi:hypothetical protein [Larkinella soli]|uniref:hypothetical protein n=1 Tax=Larkinella soli TaxID=1770527 RepID=UPI000FFBA8BB|nr:hypothetical protein [Larkinella soli]